MKNQSAHQFDASLNLESYFFRNTHQEFRNHFHENYVIGYMESGYRALRYQTRLHELANKKFFLINPYDNHECIMNDKSFMSYYSITIPIELMRKHVKLRRCENMLPRFISPVIYDKFLIDLFFNFYQSVFFVRSSKTAKNSKLICLLDHLFEKHTEFICSPEFDQSDRISLACSYLQEHLSQKITIESMCKKLGFKPTTFFANFEKKVGISPQRYLTAERINAAKKFLQQGLAIETISQLVGFCNNSHFTRNFKKVEGITPTEYRKSFTRQ